MKSKLWILFVLMTIGAWINCVFGISDYLSVGQPQTWDAIKVVIDFIVAACWTCLTIVQVRRK